MAPNKRYLNLYYLFPFSFFFSFTSSQSKTTAKKPSGVIDISDSESDVNNNKPMYVYLHSLFVVILTIVFYTSFIKKEDSK